MCTRKVLIEASEIMMDSNDGCQRYVMELLRGLLPVAAKKDREWIIDVHLGLGIIYSILDIGGFIGVKPSDPAVHNRLDFKSYRKLQIIGVLLRSWSFFINKIIKVIVSENIFTFLQTVNRKKHAWLRKYSVPGDIEQYHLVHLTLPQFYSTIAHRRTRFITTVHDLSHRHYPQFHTKNNIMSSEKGMEFSLARKSAFITVSESTRQDLLTEYPEIDPEDVFTVYEASDPKVFYHVTDQAQLKQVRQKYHIPEKPYLLALNTIEPRKNLTNTIRAFLLLIKEQPELDLSFVVAGKKGWKCQELFKEPLLQSERIVFTGFIAEEDLAALYSGALALSYVSYYEGFGLPLLEAMSCGTPVIYGNNSSMPEVVGDGGLPADPNDIEDIKEQFKRIVTDEDFRKMLAQRASHQAKKFSWEKTIKGTLEAYEKMIMNP